MRRDSRLHPLNGGIVHLVIQFRSNPAARAVQKDETKKCSGAAIKDACAMQTFPRLEVRRNPSHSFQWYHFQVPLGPLYPLWLFSAFSVLNSEKLNTEDHREPQRERAAVKNVRAVQTLLPYALILRTHHPSSRRRDKPVLRIFIFQGRVACADGIDILEKIRLLRIDAEIFAKFLVLRPR
jgi:hypothetical protein